MDSVDHDHVTAPATFMLYIFVYCMNLSQVSFLLFVRGLVPVWIGQPGIAAADWLIDLFSFRVSGRCRGSMQAVVP